jgi:AP endonuclease-1
MATKQAWNTAFAAYLAELDAKKPVVWCGDFNVVQDERDLAAASKKWNKSPGYTAIECDAHRALLEGSATPSSQPLVDVWRAKHPDAVGHYSKHP